MAIESSKQSTPRGAYYLFLGNTSATIILAVNSIVIGRLLGPPNYGLYALALVIPSYAYLLMHFGLTTASTRFAAKYSSEGHESKAVSFIYSMMCFQILLSVITILLVFLLSDFIATGILKRPELKGEFIPLATLSIVGQTVLNVGLGGYIGLGRFKRAAMLTLTQSVVKLIVSVGLVIAGFSFVGAIAGYSAGFVSAGILTLATIVVLNKRVFIKDIFSDVNTALTYSIPVYFASLANGVIPPILITLLAVAVTNKEIGGYSVVMNISSMMLIFSYPITSSLLPLFSRIANTTDLTGTYRTTVRYSGLFIVPVVAFVMLFATPIITIIFGRAYSFAGNYLLLYSVYYLLGGIGGTAWNGFLNGTGRTKQTFLANGTGFVVAIACAIPLISFLGVYGAILSFLIGSAVALGLGTLMIKRYVEDSLGLLGTWRTYAASFVSALVSYSASFLPFGSEVTTMVGGIIFILVIIPFMVIFGALRSSDVVNIEGYFKEVKSLSFFIRLAIKYYELFARWART